MHNLNEVKLDGTIVKKEIGYKSDKTPVTRLRLRNGPPVCEVYVNVKMVGEGPYHAIQRQNIIMASRVLIVGTLKYSAELKGLYVFAHYIKKLDEPVQEDLPV